MTLAHRTHLPIVTSAARLLRRAVAVAAGAAVLTAGVAGAASAASNGGSTTANVSVSSAITLTGLTPSFTLTGIPGQTYNTATAGGTVNYTVTTNNSAGYAVTVTPGADVLAPTAAGNTNSIPITAMGVSSGTTTYTAFTDHLTAVEVHRQTTQSAPTGDALITNYQVAIPFVHNDTYSATLNYMAATL